MSTGAELEFADVTKRFGTLVAVANFSARIQPGVVTGFLGPNGAGKTTSLRILLGLTHPSSGVATIGGKRYSELRQPLRHVGSVLETSDVRPRRTAARHLELTARQNQIPASRVADVLNFVGLGDEADARVSSYSLGMKQRLSIATALLGDPGAFVLDEPANGLDPEGIRWIRLLIRRLADEGRSVLVSSHVLSEIQQIADEVLIISRGELKYGGPLERLADPTGAPVVVDSHDREELRRVLSEAGLDSEILRTGLTVRGSNASDVGAIAANAGIALTTLQQRGPTLEDAFIEIVQGTWVPPEANETIDDPLFTDETWEETDEADAAASDSLAADDAVETVEATDDLAGAEPAEAVEDGAAEADDAEVAVPAEDVVDDADEATEVATDDVTEAGAEEPETVEAPAADEAEPAETAPRDDDDDVDDEVSLAEFAPVAAAASSGLGSLVRTEDTEADDAADEGADVADVTNDLQDELAQLEAAAEAAVAEEAPETDEVEDTGEANPEEITDADPADEAPVDEELAEVVDEAPAVDEVATEEAADEVAPEEEVAEAPVEEAPAAAAPRRSRRLFGRRSAAAEEPAPVEEAPVVAEAPVSEVEADDAEPGVDEPTTDDVVEAVDDIADEAEAALDEDGEASETEDVSDADEALDETKAIDQIDDMTAAVRNLVIESDPATAIIDTTHGDLGFADDSTVVIETPSSVGSLFGEPSVEDVEPAPLTKAFGIPILWDRNDTVSNTVVTAAPVDIELDDADLDVVADEVDPEKVAHIAEQVAAAEVKPTRRRRRGND